MIVRDARLIFLLKLNFMLYFYQNLENMSSNETIFLLFELKDAYYKQSPDIVCAFTKFKHLRKFMSTVRVWNSYPRFAECLERIHDKEEYIRIVEKISIYKVVRIYKNFQYDTLETLMPNDENTSQIAEKFNWKIWKRLSSEECEKNIEILTNTKIV